MIKKNKTLVKLEDIESVILSELSVGQLLPTVIDKVLITIYEGYHTIFPPMDMGKFIYNNTWKKGVGGVFNQDVVNYSRGKSTGKYLQVKSPTLNCIIRLISEEEIERFTILGLIHGQVKDSLYMVLRNLEPGGNLTNVEEFSSDIVIPNEDILFYEANAQEPTDDFEPHVGSVSLFSE